LTYFTSFWYIMFIKATVVVVLKLLLCIHYWKTNTLLNLLYTSIVSHRKFYLYECR
jgi:hypothetical protein